MTPSLGRRRSIVLLVVVATAIAGTAGAFDAVDNPSGDEVLDRVEQRYANAETITTTGTVTVENETTERTATVEFAAASDNRSRTVVETDDRTYRAGSNGSVAWAVGPNQSAAWPVDEFDGPPRQPVDEATADATAPSERFTPAGTPVMTGSNVSATVVDTPTVRGTSTYQVELTHPEVDGNTTLWVAEDDYRVVQAVATDGTNRTEVAVESTAFNVSIHDSTFDPPTDRIDLTTTERYQSYDSAQAATDLSLPALDATFVDATVTTRQGDTFVGQRYERDGTNVTILSTTASDRLDRVTDNATQRTVDGQSVNVTTTDDRAIAVWTDDGTTTAVVVEGAAERAIAIVREL